MFYINCARIMYSSTNVSCCKQTLHHYNMELKQTPASFSLTTLTNGGAL
jgi:hypothetical protein